MQSSIYFKNSTLQFCPQSDLLNSYWISQESLPHQHWLLLSDLTCRKSNLTRLWITFLENPPTFPVRCINFKPVSIKRIWPKQVKTHVVRPEKGTFRQLPKAFAWIKSCFVVHTWLICHFINGNNASKTKDISRDILWVDLGSGQQLEEYHKGLSL